MIDPRNFAAGVRGRWLFRLLFAVLGAPLLWSLHLGVIYVVLTIDCISAWNGGVWAVLAATLLFAAGSAASGWTAWSLYRATDRDESSAGEREWTRFLLVLGIGGAILFTAVILLEGASPMIVRACA